MTIVRRRHNSNFTIVPNAIFEHPDLSIEAKGVLGYLLSRPADWTVRLAHIGPALRIGRNKIERIFLELREARYVIRGDQRRAAGKWGAAEFEVWDEPSGAKELPLEASTGTFSDERDTTAAPCPGKPLTAKPHAVFRGTYKGLKENKTDSNKTAAALHAREPAGSLISETAFTIAAEIGREAGYPTEQDWPPGWCGAPHQVQRFLSDGVPPDIIKSACTAVIRRGRIPENFAYFTKPILEAWARHKAPLPTVSAPVQARTTRNGPTERNAHDIARELAEKYQQGASG
jgi:hypothetical protein